MRRSSVFSPVVLISLILFFVLLPGCVSEPNANLSYGDCCAQQAAPYSCHVKFKPGTQTPELDSNGRAVLEGCLGGCAALAKDGKVFDSSGNEVPTPAITCGSCNFKRADCSNTVDPATGLPPNACYFIDDKLAATTDVVGPVCAPKADACTQNSCKAMIYGKSAMSLKHGINAKSITSAKTVGTTAGGTSALRTQAANKDSGLLSRAMIFAQMNLKLSNKLKTPDWTVNTLRLGIGGTFSDYDRARFYMPSTDFFCPAGNPLAMVDRFTSYLKVSSAGISPLDEFTSSYTTTNYITRCGTGRQKPRNIGWHSLCSCTPSTTLSPCGIDFYGDAASDAEENCAISCTDFSNTLSSGNNNFKAPLSLCKLSFKKDPITGVLLPDTYTCDSDPALAFPIPTPADQPKAQLSCMKACNYNALKSCDRNQELLTSYWWMNPANSQYNIPPDPALLLVAPFVDAAAYGGALDANYPGNPNAPCPALDPNNPLIKSDAANYYKCLLPPPDTLEASGLRAKYGLSDTEYSDTYATESTKAGPAGGKVFECIDDGDCLSSSCDKSAYSRSSCVLDTGAQVPCGCRFIRSCDMEFRCAEYDGDSLAAFVCEANKKYCDNTQGGDTSTPVLICDYNSGNNDDKIIAWADNRYLLESGSSSTAAWNRLTTDLQQFDKFIGEKNSDGTWKYPKEMESIDYAHPELATIQRMGMKEVCDPAKGYPANPRWTCAPAGAYRAVQPEASQNGCNERVNSPSTVFLEWEPRGSDWSGSDVVHPYYLDNKQRKYACPPADRINLTTWKDDMTSFATTMRWTLSDKKFARTFSVVPNRQSVASAVSGAGNPALIVTGKTITWTSNDCSRSLSGRKPDGSDCPAGEIRFPLAFYCKMTTDADSIRDDVFQDGYPVDPSLTSSTPDITLVDETKDSGLNLLGGNTYFTDEEGPYRIDKTWKINSFGKCQAPGNVLKTVSYGMCKSCGSMLSMAYQPVYDYYSGDLTKDYCPSGCSPLVRKQKSPIHIFSWSDPNFCECPADYPYQVFNLRRPDSPQMYPNFGFLASKIDEYQGAGVLPVLDIIKYDKLSISGGNNIIKVNYKEDCGRLGGKLLGASSGGSGVVNFGSVWDCSVPSMNDWLLSYLNKSHAAAIIITDDLPSPPIKSSRSHQPPQLSSRTEADFMARLNTVATICPDCLQALHYPSGNALLSMSDVRAAKYNYPADLNYQIKSFTGLAATFPGQPPSAKEIEFDINRTTMPDDWLFTFYGKVPRPVSDIRILVIDIDLSSVDMTSIETIDSDISGLINMSRRVLQHVGWPTLWKLDFPPGAPGAYNQDLLYKRLYLRQRDMTLAGVTGILVPPLDYGQQGAQNPTFPKLSIPGKGTLLASGQTVSSLGTAFCAAQKGSNTFLHPKITAGITKVIPKSSCACTPCTDMEIALGRCPGQACEDGSVCTPKTGQAPGQVKCEPYCVVRDCELCSGTLMGAKKITCNALRSDNEPPRLCGPPGSPWQNFPDCELLVDVQLKDVAANIDVSPELYAPLIAGLPAGHRCCLQKVPGDVDTTYTYRSAASVTTSAEPVIFPAYGANTTDCGRMPDPTDVAAAASCNAPPPPLNNMIWTCTAPAP